MLRVHILSCRNCRVILRILVILVAVNIASARRIGHKHIQRQKPKSSMLGNCDSSETVTPGEIITIRNPGWPQIYSAGIMCRWKFECPGSTCHLHCSDVGLPQSKKCFVDMLLVSESGSTELDNAQIYCGRTVIDSKSAGQALTLALSSSPKSPGGRFVCTVRTESEDRRLNLATEYILGETSSDTSGYTFE
ncbi:uncharacterized protein LOC142982833 [Anticarsia gemmatalis]|uniref:uncharacterized protein LOC142982833 n=1 Tax=Anticarsia gemmatalis TaxID=129554 RepID=UPI003F7740D7